MQKLKMKVKDLDSLVGKNILFSHPAIVGKAQGCIFSEEVEEWDVCKKYYILNNETRLNGGRPNAFTSRGLNGFQCSWCIAHLEYGEANKESYIDEDFIINIL